MATTTDKVYTLDEYKSEKEKELERAREAAKLEADIGFAKLQKYLTPSARTAAQGYSQGLSETAMIAAENSRQRAHAAADSAYASGYNDLMAAYRSEKKAEQQAEQAEQQAMYEDVLGVIDNGEWNTTAELQKYLYGEDGQSGATAGLTEAQKSVIAQKYSTIAGNPEQQAYEQDMSKVVSVGTGGLVLDKNVGLFRKGWGAGDNISIKDADGNTYAVESGGELTDTVIIEKAKKAGIKNEQVFEYDGIYYIRVDDKYYSIRKRRAGDGAQYEKMKKVFAGESQPTATPTASSAYSSENWIAGTAVAPDGTTAKTRKHR